VWLPALAGRMRLSPELAQSLNAARTLPAKAGSHEVVLNPTAWLPNHPQRRVTALRGRRSELRYPRLLSASGEGHRPASVSSPDHRPAWRRL